MNLKKFISGISALTIAASAFAGLAVTASAASLYELDLSTTTSGQVTVKLNTSGGPSAADNTGASITAEEVRYCDVPDFGTATTYTAAVPALDGWGYRHDSYNSLKKNNNNDQASGRQTSVQILDTGAIRLNDIANSVPDGYTKAALTFTPANVDNLAVPTSGTVYYSFTASVANTSNSSASIELGFNTDKGATVTGTGTTYISVPKSTSTAVDHTVYMTYNIDSGEYVIKLDDAQVATGTNANIQGIYTITPSNRYDSIAISNFEYGTVEAVQAAYKLNYYYNDTLIKTVEKTDYEGSSITLSNEDKAAVTYNDAKYYYVSDDSSSKTVASNGSTVVNVTYRAAVPYTARLSLVDATNTSTILGTRTRSVEDTSLSARVYYPIIIQYNGDYYYKGSTGDTNGYWSTAVSSASDAAPVEVGYTKMTGNIVYYAEFDSETDGGTNETNYAARYSDGVAVVSGSKSITLDAGYYDIYVGMRNGGAGNRTFEVLDSSSNALGSKTVSAGTTNTEKFAGIKLAAQETITISEKSTSNIAMDYVYVEKLGDYRFNFTDGPVYVYGNSGDSVYLPSPADTSFKGWKIDGTYYAGGTSYTFTDHDVDATVANSPVEISDTDYQTITYNNEEYTAAKLLVTVNGTVNGIRVWYGNLHRDATDMSVITDGTILLGAIVESGVTVDSNTFTVEAIN